MSTPRIRRFAQNRAGRDFVIGDLHGMVELLLSAMDQVGYDPACDRIFSVGDLIDRGPESHRAAEVLRIPGLYAVKGNHEGMLLDVVDAFGIESPTMPEIYVRNGLGWWRDTPIARRHEIIDAIRDLPLVMEVETERGSVGFVHAEVPAGMSWQQFCTEIDRGGEAITEHATWSRERVKAGDERGVAGIGRVFVGHTPMPAGVRRLGNVYYVDTGAVFGAMGGRESAGLTIANIVMSTNQLQGAVPAKTLLNLLVDSTSTPATPFGAYARTAAMAGQ
jgi:serine/threonine protein phosphatase 1